MSEPQLGAFFVQRGYGTFGAVIRFVTRSDVNHAGIYVGDGKIVEALSDGMVVSPVPTDGVTWSRMVLTDKQRRCIVDEAYKLVGIPYGWLDVFCIGLLQYGVRLPSVYRRVRRQEYLFCSQAVDRAYLLAGVHLFNDGRASQDVTPGDLHNLIEATEGRVTT